MNAINQNPPVRTAGGKQEQRGYKPGWTSNKYKERYGKWPRGLGGDPIPPSKGTRAWIRKEAVKYARQCAG